MPGAGEILGPDDGVDVLGLGEGDELRTDDFLEPVAEEVDGVRLAFRGLGVVVDLVGDGEADGLVRQGARRMGPHQEDGQALEHEGEVAHVVGVLADLAGEGVAGLDHGLQPGLGDALGLGLAVEGDGDVRALVGGVFQHADVRGLAESELGAFRAEEFVPIGGIVELEEDVDAGRGLDGVESRPLGRDGGRDVGVFPGPLQGGLVRPRRVGPGEEEIQPQGGLGEGHAASRVRFGRRSPKPFSTRPRRARWIVSSQIFRPAT